MQKLPIDFKKNKQQILIVAGVVAVVFIFLYFNLLLKPQVVRVFASAKKTGMVSRDLKGALSDIAKMDSFRKDLASYSEKVERYEKMLPVEQEVPALLESLSNIAKESRVNIVGIMPKTGKKEDAKKSLAYQEIPITISAKSGYHELGRFLANLESADRFIKVAEIRIRAGKASPKKHDVELVVQTYVLH